LFRSVIVEELNVMHKAAFVVDPKSRELLLLVSAANIAVPLASHGLGETRVQNSSKTLVSKKAIALTTFASFI